MDAGAGARRATSIGPAVPHVRQLMVFAYFTASFRAFRARTLTFW